MQTRTDLINSQKAEYENYLSTKNTKLREKSTNYKKKDSEPQGTFKIGGENREIKRKSYYEVTENLNLNPTRQESNQNFSNQINQDYYTQQRHNAAANNFRNKSRGYNIINHTDENLENPYSQNLQSLQNQRPNNLAQGQKSNFMSPNESNNNKVGVDSYENNYTNFDKNYYNAEQNHSNNYNKNYNYQNEKTAQEPENPDIDEYDILYQEYLKKLQNENPDEQAFDNIPSNTNVRNEKLEVFILLLYFIDSCFILRLSDFV